MNKREFFLINCKVIAQLKPNMRLNTTEELYRVHTVQQWIPSFLVRWFHGQSRSCDIMRIHSMFQEAIKLHGNDEQLRNACIDSIQGLQHLKITYSSDVTAIAQLDVIIELLHHEFDIQDEEIHLTN